ncbi:MAG: hypothetical protein WHT06_05080 [Desulfobacterales bacterium]
MKRLWLLTARALGLSFPPRGSADLMPPVFIYCVDAAPPKYGSPDYRGWETDAFAKASAGTFVNMADRTDPAFVGTTNFVIEYESALQLRRLGENDSPGSTGSRTRRKKPSPAVSRSAGSTSGRKNFWTYNESWGSAGLAPTSRQNQDKVGNGKTDGVVGTAGMAWWGAYGVNTPEALAADLAEWAKPEEYWIFRAKPDDKIDLLNSCRAPVPEPLPLLLRRNSKHNLFPGRPRRKTRSWKRLIPLFRKSMNNDRSPLSRPRAGNDF